MNAKFKTDAGPEFDISVQPSEGAKPGNIPPVHMRVSLIVAAPGATKATIHAPLKRSEARAIASALMGAAAEL